MKSGVATIFQIIIVFIGMVALAFLLGEPQFEGRNAHATLFEVYFQDPFLAYVYAGSLPFFLALHRAYFLLGDARRTGAFSQVTVDALRTIRHCAVVVLGFAAGGIVIIIRFGDQEDRPPGVVLALLVSFASGVVEIASRFASMKLRESLARKPGGRG